MGPPTRWLWTAKSSYKKLHSSLGGPLATRWRSRTLLAMVSCGPDLGLCGSYPMAVTALVTTHCAEGVMDPGRSSRHGRCCGGRACLFCVTHPPCHVSPHLHTRPMSVRGLDLACWRTRAVVLPLGGSWGCTFWARILALTGEEQADGGESHDWGQEGGLWDGQGLLWHG